MSQTKEIRIRNHFQATIQRNEAKFWSKFRDETGLEPRDGCPEWWLKNLEKTPKEMVYDETILFLATHWKMKCVDIKRALNEAKNQLGLYGRER
jgi:hypothetical protein